MKKQKGSILLGSLVVILIIGGALAFYVSKLNALEKQYEDTKSEVDRLEKLREISVSDGIQIRQALFEFINIPTEITFRFKEEYDRPKGGFGAADEQVDIIFRTNYEFTYGYNLDGWNWCASVSNDKPGFVEVRRPSAVWTNKNTEIAPTEWFTLEGVHYQKQLGKKIQSDQIKRLKDKLAETSKRHLSDEAMNSNMERALKEFLAEVMNSSHKESNPVSGVTFIDNLDSDCKEKPLVAIGS